MGINHLSAAKFSQLSLPIAPPEEQPRIVAEIEKQFTRLDAGIAALGRAQSNLRRYRAAVLKAACEGRLVPTEAELARRDRRSYETANQLLNRVLLERRKRWSGRGRYAEASLPEGAELPLIPEGWAWTTLDAVAEIKGGITKDQKRKPDTPRAVPYLRVANVQRGYLDLSEMKEILATKEEIAELALRPGDVLFNEGGDRDKLGRGWVWSGEIPVCIHQNHVFRARLYDHALQPKFVSWYANWLGQRFFFDKGKHTTNLASISMSKLRLLPIPVPPPAEQMRIVVEVERLLSVIDALEIALDAEHASCESPPRVDSPPGFLWPSFRSGRRCECCRQRLSLPSVGTLRGPSSRPRSSLGFTGNPRLGGSSTRRLSTSASTLLAWARSRASITVRRLDLWTIVSSMQTKQS